jgi:hypothetical protein
VTNLDAPIEIIVGFYGHGEQPRTWSREANSDAGLATHLSACWTMNCVHFQLAMMV